MTKIFFWEKIKYLNTKQKNFIFIHQLSLEILQDLIMIGYKSDFEKDYLLVKKIINQKEFEAGYNSIYIADKEIYLYSFNVIISNNGNIYHNEKGPILYQVTPEVLKFILLFNHLSYSIDNNLFFTNMRQLLYKSDKKKLKNSLFVFEDILFSNQKISFLDNKVLNIELSNTLLNSILKIIKPVFKTKNVALKYRSFFHIGHINFIVNQNFEQRQFLYLDTLSKIVAKIK